MYCCTSVLLPHVVHALCAHLWWQVAAGFDPEGPNTDALEEAISLAQHHDAVTGTAKQHVADDYNMRIATGASSGEKLSVTLTSFVAI